MNIRPAIAAGKLYAADADELITNISQNLLSFPVGNVYPRGLVVPHADMLKTGHTSASAFRQLSKSYSFIDNVIILGAASDSVRGAVLPICDEYRTPLGSVKIEERLIRSLSLFPFVHRCDREHFSAQNIEVQLPYLQTCLSDFKILPILIGEISYIDLDLLLASLPNSRSTLIILSLDVAKDSQRCLDFREQLIFERYLEHVESERRELKRIDASISTEDLRQSKIIYQSYIVH